MKRFLTVLAFCSGVLSCFSGMALLVVYVREAILLRGADPDQSLLFWYLPLVFVGVMLLAAGGCLFVLGGRLAKKEAPGHMPVHP